MLAVLKMPSFIQLSASDDTLKSVTLFRSDRAEVTRVFSVTLEVLELLLVYAQR